ncbi:carbon storage regulator [Aquisphaera insulae]|uniref:carbon storage regulator n=1 Tax=Aquisphaera insulae TaxID=2712864 RepID=UPI0013EC556A|nr:carbon storage regulator [Aquisphaera insulae]
MLVLSRKVDAQIVIGDHIRLTIVSIRGNRVRLGVEAPTAVSVFRHELVPESVEAEILVTDQAAPQSVPASTCPL